MSEKYTEFKDEPDQEAIDPKDRSSRLNVYLDKQKQRKIDASKSFTGIGGTRITVGDLVWQFVFLCIFVGLCWYFYVEYEEKWWAGALVYGAVFSLGYEVFMHYVMGYGLLDPMDKLFNFDIEKNNAMIVGFFEIEKFDYFSMKSYLSRKVAFNDRFKSKMVKHVGSYYYEKLKDDEFIEQSPEIFQLLEGIHSEKQIADFLGVEANIRESDDTVQYRFFLVPDYSKDTSAILIKFHHSFADGIGLVCTLCCLEEQFDKSKIIELVPKMSCSTRLCLLLCLPFSVTMQSLKSLCLAVQNNALKNPSPLTGIKRGAFTDSFSLQAVKDKAKQHNCQVNDILFAITSVTFGEYMRERNDDSSKINIVCPFTLRRLPDSPKQLQMQNDFAPVPLSLAIRPNFEDAIKTIHEYMQGEKRSFNAHGTYWQFQIVCGWLPTLIGLYLTEFMASRFTMVISNVPGPRKSIVYDGKKSITGGFFVPALGKLSTGLSYLSHIDTMKIGFCSDKAYVEDPQILIDMMQKNVEKYLLDGKA